MRGLVNKVKHWYGREKKILLCSVAAGVVFTAAFGVVTKEYSDRMQNGIAERVVRFHVRANSNSYEDQMLKLAVKDSILDRFENELDDAGSVEDSKEILFIRMEEIRRHAEEEIAARGYDYPVSVGFGTEYFPTKRYGDVTLPAGEYEALCVNIGDGVGNNWWCVMYPPLCYVDVTKSALSDKTKQQLKEELSDGEYELITFAADDNTEPDVKIKFKIVEWWQKRKGPQHTDEAVLAAVKP